MAFIHPFDTLICPGLMDTIDTPLPEIEIDDEEELPVYDCGD